MFDGQIVGTMGVLEKNKKSATSKKSKRKKSKK